MTKTAGIAVLVFAVALTLGTLVDREPEAVAAVTTTSGAPTTTAAPLPVFVSPAETVVGPAVMVAAEPELDRNQVVVNFDLFSRAPTADAGDVLQQLGFGNTLTIEPEDLDTVFLDDWILSTSSGDIPGTVANPAARAARFDVGENFDLSSIRSVSLASYSLLTPVSASIRLDAGSESSPMAPGITARLLAVTEQANTIVQVELLSDRGFNLDNLRVSGEGPGWLSAVREAEGRPRWNLTFDSEAAPSPISMRVEGSVWISVDQTITLTAGGDR